MARLPARAKHAFVYGLLQRSKDNGSTLGGEILKAITARHADLETGLVITGVSGSGKSASLSGGSSSDEITMVEVSALAVEIKELFDQAVLYLAKLSTYGIAFGTAPEDVPESLTAAANPQAVTDDDLASEIIRRLPVITSRMGDHSYFWTQGDDY